MGGNFDFKMDTYDGPVGKRTPDYETGSCNVNFLGHQRDIHLRKYGRTEMQEAVEMVGWMLTDTGELVGRDIRPATRTLEAGTKPRSP